jgi:DNA-binding beta-propeller fold protein YncE
MERRSIFALVVVVLILVGFGGVVTKTNGQTGSSTATTCPPACQEIVPIIPFANGSAPVQANPQPPVFAGDTGMYVSNEGSNTVSVVTGPLTAGTVSVGPSPLQGAYDPYGGLFYVPDSGADELSVLSGASLDTNIQLQASPLTPAFDPLNGYMYVPDNGGCDIAGSDSGSPCGTTVSVVSGVSVIANITVGTAPMEPVVDTNVNSPYYGFVYVPSAVSQTISVISGKNNSVVATIGSGPTYPVLVPRPPGGGVYDSADDTVYMGSYVIHGIDVVGQLPTLSLSSQSLNGITPQFQVSCTASCVYDPYNGLIYEPSDPYQPVFQGFILINGTNATPFTDCGCGDDAVFNPRNGWVYMGGPVVSGDTPFALAAPVAGALYGPQSFNPDDGFVYGVSGQSAIRIGNFCPQIGGEYNYSALDLQICNGGGSQITATTNNVTATSVGGVNGSGSHIFSIVTAGNIPMAAGNWTASGSKIVGQAGGAVISFSLTGQSGSKGMATITILKSEIVFLLGASALVGVGALPTDRSIASWQPQLFIDGQQVTDTTITQDSTYVYVTFPIHFSTHQVQLKWISSADAIGTANSSGTTSAVSSTVSSSSSGNGLSSSISTPTTTTTSSSASGLAIGTGYLLIVGVSMAVALTASVLAKTKRTGATERKGGP